MTFVGDDGGASAGLTAITIISATLPVVARNMLAVFNPNCKLFNRSSFWLTFLTEFIFIVLPVELIVTVFNQQSPYFLAIALTINVILILTRLCKHDIRASWRKTDLSSIPMKNVPFISYFRAYTNIFTGLSIFAVVFVIYPTYFLKSRVYGTSLMDTGLGFYLISNAIVSKEARGTVSSKSVSFSILAAVKDTLPLIVLGVLRIALTKATDYHVPFLEYGIHWNFFFTLAVVKFISALVYSITPKKLWPFLWLLVMLPYQYCLSATRLFFFVFFGFSGSASRDGFLEANREGIVSSVGFLAVYFVGVQIGSILFRKRTTVKEWAQCCCQMVCVCFISWALMMYTTDYIQKPSRKLANISYLFFMIGVSSLLMIEGMVFDIILTCLSHVQEEVRTTGLPQPEKSDSRCSLLMAVNYNGLLFFVVANLMTGSVNMMLVTRSLSPEAAYAIVTVYMFILSLLFLYLYWKRLSFKAFLWRNDQRTSLRILNA